VLKLPGVNSSFPITAHTLTVHFTWHYSIQETIWHVTSDMFPVASQSVCKHPLKHEMYRWTLPSPPAHTPPSTFPTYTSRCVSPSTDEQVTTAHARSCIASTAPSNISRSTSTLVDTRANSQSYVQQLSLWLGIFHNSKMIFPAAIKPNADFASSTFFQQISCHLGSTVLDVQGVWLVQLLWLLITKLQWKLWLYSCYCNPMWNNAVLTESNKLNADTADVRQAWLGESSHLMTTDNISTLSGLRQQLILGMLTLLFLLPINSSKHVMLVPHYWECNNYYTAMYHSFLTDVLVAVPQPSPSYPVHTCSTILPLLL
jgi:hypothetical protein